MKKERTFEGCITTPKKNSQNKPVGKALHHSVPTSTLVKILEVSKKNRLIAGPVLIVTAFVIAYLAIGHSTFIVNKGGASFVSKPDLETATISDAPKLVFVTVLFSIFLGSLGILLTTGFEGEISEPDFIISENDDEFYWLSRSYLRDSFICASTLQILLFSWLAMVLVVTPQIDKYVIIPCFFVLVVPFVTIEFIKPNLIKRKIGLRNRILHIQHWFGAKYSMPVDNILDIQENKKYLKVSFSDYSPVYLWKKYFVGDQLMYIKKSLKQQS